MVAGPSGRKWAGTERVSVEVLPFFSRRKHGILLRVRRSTVEVSVNREVTD